MGRAIVRLPSVFLMDEPLSNLDAKLRVQMRADIAALQHDLGTTTVYVTHDQSEAMTLGHRVAVLDDGRLQQVGTPRELYDRPANLFVAGFIGSPAMNLCEVPLGCERLGRRSAASRRAPRRRSTARSQVVVGLRPESLELGGRRHPGRGRGRRGVRRRRLRLLRRTVHDGDGGTDAARRAHARRKPRPSAASGSPCASAPARRICSTPNPAGA